MSKWIPGHMMPEATQRNARARFVHRFTGEHKPDWAYKPRSDGSLYPVQFKDDWDWLCGTLFCVKADGTLSDKTNYCESKPSWPDNPELRKPRADSVKHA